LKVTSFLQEARDLWYRFSARSGAYDDDLADQKWDMFYQS